MTRTAKKKPANVTHWSARIGAVSNSLRIGPTMTSNFRRCVVIATAIRRIRGTLPAKGVGYDSKSPIERHPTARFTVYVCNLDDEPYQRVAEYHSISDVLARKRRFEQVIKVQVGRQFVTWEEFVGWAVGQGYCA